MASIENKTIEPPWPPKIQIAGISSLTEALFCCRIGVDTLGFTLGLPTGIHDGLTFRKAKLITEKLPRNINIVIITYLKDAKSACALATYLNASAVQFHGGISEEQLELFRRICASVKTIGCVTVRGPDAVDKAALFDSDLWDAIILDSFDPTTGRKGHTGKIHDWNISAQIVKNSKIPVILAGGLNPENVAEAIKKVRPFGVDVHTGVEAPNGSRSFTRIEAFVREAAIAFRNLIENTGAAITNPQLKDFQS